MLEAFVLGFWLIWSADRDIYPLTESLWFTILAVIMRQLTAFAIPEIDGYWAALNGALWAYVAVVFMIVNRFSTSFMTTMLMAAAAGVGYFQLLQYLPDWVNGWLS
ncbi:multidrug transporter MatE [Neisseria sp. N95_16]|uniref:Multidrug transporter MatE n=1 Tax=Neisseria brasiliensis TaxID=2666100 RepID=A0A5Q3S160_9NEIS|nr:MULTISPECIES: multidrug transporter MatE [Neisseria]MRN37550.1 multidrug transporter MatE [Neisseria brasiliensis]PJO09182.1 multidrug transporter MatE [Neisseria sp. N95_16]PJO79322.1 multidrug transporter MatE [Neisseria sp. N177_16]QGL24538.1 multidrug transporter MatE [Neisseria brasiliensis]